MKTLVPTVAFLALGLAASLAHAQFPNYPAADKVLGASDFTTGGSQAANASGFINPRGLAVDPVSGKLFVASSVQHRILRFASAGGLANGANAESVFGQANLSDTASGATATTLNSPYGLHLDGSGRLWVADLGNHRVLMFSGASSAGFGQAPGLVLGQPNFTTVTSGTTATKMNQPAAVFVDASDNLWVADAANHRVLKFANVSGLANGAAATNVFGQPDMVTGISGLSDVKMNVPVGVTVDAAGRLWVADDSNNRVLRFDLAASLGNGPAATAVLGQPDFTTNILGVTAQKMASPTAVLFDAAGTLYVLETSNRRVLQFKNPAGKANGGAADVVIGQPDFTSSMPDTTDRMMSLPGYGLAIDAARRLWVADSGNDRVLGFPADLSAVPPRVTGRVPRTTTRPTLTVRGTATDPNGVTAVRHRAGSGAFRNAAGTSSWRFTARLKPKTNKIEIVAIDTLGNTSPAKRLKVTRKH